MMNDEELRSRLCIVYIQSSLGERIARYLLRENRDDNAYKRLMDRLIQDEKDFVDFDKEVLSVIPHINYINHYDTEETLTMAENIRMYFGIVERV